MNNPWDITKRDGSYDSCEFACARLLIYCDNCSPDEISEALGLQPTEVGIKGEIIKNSIGRVRGTNRNSWVYSTESACNSLDLRDHVDMLLSHLDERIRNLQSLKEIKMGVDCIWWSKGSGGPTLTSEQMLKLGKLGLECSFSVSFYGADGEDTTMGKP